MPTLPPELAPALRNRRRSLVSQGSGRVLDLGGWTDHADAYPAGTDVTVLEQLDGLGRVDGEFDTIVSLIRTPLVADLGRWLEQLTGCLAADGRILFLEPTVRPGRTGQLLAVGGRFWRPLSGLHLDRDIPNVIRSHGLFITDLSRFEVPTLSAPLRPFVEGQARRPTAD